MCAVHASQSYATKAQRRKESTQAQLQVMQPALLCLCMSSPGVIDCCNIPELPGPMPLQLCWLLCLCCGLWCQNTLLSALLLQPSLHIMPEDQLNAKHICEYDASADYILFANPNDEHACNAHSMSMQTFGLQANINKIWCSR